MHPGCSPRATVSWARGHEAPLASLTATPRARAHASGDGELDKPRLARTCGRDGAGRGVHHSNDLKTAAPLPNGHRRRERRQWRTTARQRPKDEDHVDTKGHGEEGKWVEKMRQLTTGRFGWSARSEARRRRRNRRRGPVGVVTVILRFPAIRSSPARTRRRGGRGGPGAGSCSGDASMAAGVDGKVAASTS